MSPSPSSLAALLLCQRLQETPAAPLKSSEYWALLAAVGVPAALLGLDAAAIAGRFGIDTPLAERVATLLDAATGFALRLEEAEQQGLRLASSVDDGYPQVLIDRLASRAPPLLYLVGDPTLLRADQLGIVGSRAVGDQTAEVARQAATAAVAAGFGVVSGAVEAIRQATAPVRVWTGPGAGPGNPLLSQRGGIGVGRLAGLFPLPDPPPPRAPGVATDQLALEV